MPACILARAHLSASTNGGTVSEKNCIYNLDSLSTDISVQGGSVSVKVTTQADCAWTATTTAAWISITSGSSGTGNGATKFTVPANTGLPRTGTLTIAGHIYTVTQT